MGKRPKNPKFKLWQQEDGQWCCSTGEILNSWVIAKTADEAIANQKIVLADFHQMQDHFDGICTEPCRWCKDHPDLKGIYAKKNPVDAARPRG